MIFDYRARADDRWMSVDPAFIGEHDFKNPTFQLRFHGKDRTCMVRSMDHLNAIREHEMANYANAGPDKTDAINPSHYKELLITRDSHGNVVDTVQWLEHLQYKPFWRNNMRAFVQAVMDMCCDKYLSRMGMKDDELQEMEKSLWYHNFAAAIMKNSYKPVRVKDVAEILSGKTKYFVSDENDHLVTFDNGELYTYSKDEAIAACATSGYFIIRDRV